LAHFPARPRPRPFASLIRSRVFFSSSACFATRLNDHSRRFGRGISGRLNRMRRLSVVRSVVSPLRMIVSTVRRDRIFASLNTLQELSHNSARLESAGSNKGTARKSCPTLWRTACMKPERRRVVLGLVIAGFAFAIVLAIARVHPADLAAPGLKFVSPAVTRN
jgi:hypothetical protein